MASSRSPATQVRLSVVSHVVRSFDATSLLYLLLVVANKDYTLSTSTTLPAETKDEWVS